MSLSVNELALQIILARFDLSINQLIWQIIIALAIGGTLAYLFWQKRRMGKSNVTPVKKEVKEEVVASKQMQLHAYERLILLTDRIALPNLISRVNEPGLSGRDMQMVLIHNIKTEFEHNITQQIYVAHEAWDAVRNLKDQNMVIINQIASYLPAESTGQELNRAILEMLMQNPNASLHNIVADVLSFEARKLMQQQA